MTKYKLEMTYPGNVPEEIEIEEAKAAIGSARRIKDFVKKKAKELVGAGVSILPHKSDR